MTSRKYEILMKSFEKLKWNLKRGGGAYKDWSENIFFFKSGRARIGRATLFWWFGQFFFSIFVHF